MIIKANKQIGFIYKNDESIDKILKDGDVVFERGFLRERTTTTLPITFGGVGKDLKDYKIYGNTYQNSTSGKNKYGITSAIPKVYRNSLPVGKTSNLIVDEYDLNNIKFHTIASGLYYQVLLPTYQLEPNTNYIVSYTRTNTLSSGASARRYIYNVDANNNYSLIHALNSGDNGNMSYTFETTETGKVAIAFGFYNNQSVNESEINNLMIRLATDIDDTFEPYTNGPSPNPDYPQEIISVGDLVTDSQDEHYGKYKIPVNVRSENLFDINTITPNTYITNAGATGSSSVSNLLDYIPVYKDKPIIVSYDYDTLVNTTNRSLVFYDTNKNYISGQYYSPVSKKQQFIPEQDGYIRFAYDKNYTNIYISYYNETTNIYLDEPLRKIGEYSDYIDFANGKVVRQLGEVILDGDEDISRVSARSNKYRFVVGIDNINMIAISNMGDYNPILSDKYISKNRDQTYANETGIGYGDGSSYYKNLIIYDENLSSFTIEQFKTWLQSNNVTVDYVLATPTEESITLPNIPTIDGNNTLNIETEITPSQVYIKYKSNE